MKTLRRIATAEKGWPRLAYAAAIAVCAIVGPVYALHAAPPMNTVLPALAAAVAMGLAARPFMGAPSGNAVC